MLVGKSAFANEGQVVTGVRGKWKFLAEGFTFKIPFLASCVWVLTKGAALKGALSLTGAQSQKVCPKKALLSSQSLQSQPKSKGVQE